MNPIEAPGVWTTPELIVLVRSNPEESVLTNCKAWGGPWSGADPENIQEGCSTTVPNTCHWCDAKGQS
jgi:hypothetical protein